MRRVREQLLRGGVVRSALVPIGLLWACLIGVGIAQPLTPFSLPATLVLALLGTMGLAWVRPYVATVLAMAIPLISEVASSSLVVYAGFLLLMVATVRMWATSSKRARRVARLIVAFGAVTVFFGVFLADERLHRGQLVLAVLYATGIGVAAAISNMGPTFVVASISSLGVWASLMASRVPALRSDRNIVVLGENANGIGMFAALGVVAALIGSMNTRGPRRWLFLVGVGICSWGVYFSGSRGALVMVLVGAIVLLMGRWFRGPSVRSAFVVLVASVALVFGAGQLNARFSDATGRTASGVDPSFRARSETLSYAIQQGLEHPVFGVGLGQLGAISEADSSSRTGIRAHNTYAGVFAELGGVALVLMLVLCFLAVYQARRHSVGALALVAAVGAAGISLDWWGAGRTGVVAMFILGWGAGISITHDRSLAGNAPSTEPRSLWPG